MVWPSSAAAISVAPIAPLARYNSRARFQNGLKFAEVAGPGFSFECLNGRGVKHDGSRFLLGGGALELVHPHKFQVDASGAQDPIAHPDRRGAKVVGPLAQGGQPKHHAGQAVVQIVPERPRSDVSGQIPIRHRDDPHIEAFVAADGGFAVIARIDNRRASPFATAGLEQPQQGGLNPGTETRRFLDQEGAAIGRLRQSRAPVAPTEQRECLLLGKAADVVADERTVGARQVGERPSQALFPRTRLSQQNEIGSIRAVGQPLDDVQDARHRGMSGRHADERSDPAGSRRVQRLQRRRRFQAAARRGDHLHVSA